MSAAVNKAGPADVAGARLAHAVMNYTLAHPDRLLLEPEMLAMNKAAVELLATLTGAVVPPQVRPATAAERLLAALSHDYAPGASLMHEAGIGTRREFEAAIKMLRETGYVVQCERGYGYRIGKLDKREG